VQIAQPKFFNDKTQIEIAQPWKKS